ncbi:hypothetical protein TRIP_D420196 [uncultured Paludibacter sp.]|uniref:Uncharacterized protein n=1 Tax=uncultured Paludibacter sp. TaxID=497635 RepID=A0A653AH70_9BACT|nr:hypothetical protein TRIP_D420196 [uncultured Paludibacter sp.]
MILINDKIYFSLGKGGIAKWNERIYSILINDKTYFPLRKGG